MACDHTQMWNLSGLVAAFLDLWIAYLLLCASAFVYFASKFMGFFGLSLPCPCDGIFCNIRSRNLCLNSLLVDLPSIKVTDVQISVKEKLPFCIDQRGASCSSSPDLPLLPPVEVTGDGYRKRSRISVQRNKHPSVYYHIDRDKDPLDNAETSADSATKPEYESVDEEEENGVRILEQELAALYTELENERNAAASATEEALSMILRLQDEKASIYMEARQSQRIIEEKYAYDAEEINILKEILVRTEKEKHYLEKEVEAFRQMALSEDPNDARPSFYLNDDPISILRHFIKKDGKFSSKAQRVFEEKSEGIDLHEKEIISEFEQIQEIGVGCEIGEKIIETCSGSLCSYPSLKQDKVSDTNIDESEWNLSSSAAFESSVTEMMDTQAHELSPIIPLEPQSVLLSSFDTKMLEIHGEVGLLQERLKLIQKGREKLQSLDETQAIRPVTNTRKALRHLSLPLPPTKVNSRKRRSRSVSCGFQTICKG